MPDELHHSHAAEGEIELLRVQGDRGAREVVTRDAGRLADVDFAFAMPADVDDRGALDGAERGR